MVELELSGCRPEPLAHYLKALAVLRLVSEQADPAARGFWRGDCFVLQSALDRDGQAQTRREFPALSHRTLDRE